MNIIEPEKQILNDFAHKVTNTIKLYGNYPDFPKMEDYGIEGMGLDDYLFDKQAILDMGGSSRNKLTVGGIITLLPVIVLSAFPYSDYIFGMMGTTVLAIAVCLMLALCLYAVLKAIIRFRLARHADLKFETYIKAVLFYQPRQESCSCF